MSWAYDEPRLSPRPETPESSHHLPLIPLESSPPKVTDWLSEALSTCGAYRLVDGVTRESTEEIEVHWTPAADAPFYRTDGADRLLLLPGTVALEHAVQAGEALIYRRRGRAPEEGVPVLARVRSLKCRRMIHPARTLRTTVRWLGQTGPAFEVRATTHVDGEKATEAELVYTAASIPELAPG